MIRFLVLAVTVFLIGCSSLQPQPRLASALVFHAPFDQSADAVLGAGDRRIQTGPSWGAPRSSHPGLPTEGTVSVKPNEGRYGGALYFSKKIPQMVGFRVPGNMPFRTNNWSGSISFWLKVSPDEDLEPGYCDVIQVTSKGWDDASLFVEFTKDEKPREMRLGVYADKAVWNVHPFVGIAGPMSPLLGIILTRGIETGSVGCIWMVSRRVEFRPVNRLFIGICHKRS